MSSDDFSPVKTPHTSIFLILLLPFGISSGYVSVTLDFTLSAHGLSGLAATSMIAAGVFPQIFKVAWAPIVDTTLTPKRWYVIGALVMGAGFIAMSLIPEPIKVMKLLIALIMISSIASSFTSMASETFMANLPSEQQGRAAGWSQGGTFTGYGLGGGLGLYLAQHVHAQWVSGAALGFAGMLCALPLLLLTTADRPLARPRLRETLIEVAMDVWSVVRTRAGLLVALLMLLPLGTSAAGGVLNGNAGVWGVGGNLVASVGGVLTGLVSAATAIGAGYVLSRFDRRTCYCVFGCMVTLALVPMALAPRTPVAWIAGSLAYAGVIGACYAAYSAVIFEAIGKGAAATKFNLMSSISNVPVTFIGPLDGWLYDHHGANAMFFGESALGIVSALFFGLVVISTRRWRPMPNPA